MEMTQLVSVEQGRDLKKLGFPLEIKLLEDMPSNWKGKAFFTGMATCYLCYATFFRICTKMVGR